MDLGILATLLGIGYIFNKEGVKREKDQKFFSNPSKNQEINGTNIYNSYRTVQNFEWEQKQMNKIYNAFENDPNANRIIPGPPKPLFQKVDGEQKNLPLKYDDSNVLRNKADKLRKEAEENKYYQNQNLPVNDLNFPHDTNFAMAGAWSGISLTGLPMNQTNYKHNNMIPYFGGSVKQNVDEFSTQQTLENFTGNKNYFQDKVEVERNNLFPPVANLTNPYGQSNLDGYNYDRYIVSNIRSNEAPIEQIRVGPGLNKGYTWEPSGGFQQADTLDYIRPLTTDEIRVKTKPKVSYAGRLIAGSKIAKPGKVGVIEKNRPDTFFVNSQNRLFTTLASSGQAQTARPAIYLMPQQRRFTEGKKWLGAAAPTDGGKESLRPKIKKSNKIVYNNNGVRNATLNGKWSIESKNIPNDYGKNSMRAPITNRQILENKSRNGNLTGGQYRGHAPINPKLRKSRKTNVIGSAQWAGAMKPQQPSKGPVYDPNNLPKTTIKETNIHNSRKGNMAPQRPANGQVYDPNDIARTTIKETNIHNSRKGNMAPQRPANGQVYDPNDIARTTIKETNIHNSRKGNMAPQRPANGQVYDPNDVARTTIKETNIHNSRKGNMAPQRPANGQVYDPNDVARTTIKETNIHNSRQGNMAPQRPSKGKVYDPNDIARTTTKETTIYSANSGYMKPQQPSKGYMKLNSQKLNPTNRQLINNNNYVGIIDKISKGFGYITKKVFAPNTNRQFTSTEYTGDAKGNNKGGYTIADVKINNTNRQFTTTEYEGIAGPAGESKPMSYDDIYNSTVKSLREVISKGRTPGRLGPKKIVGSNMVNVTRVKDKNAENIMIQERGLQNDKIYNSIPQKNQCGETHFKDTLPNKPIGVDRIEPGLLDAFRKNPFTQPLDSFFFP
jgi:hypothetical protein